MTLIDDYHRHPSQSCQTSHGQDRSVSVSFLVKKKIHSYLIIRKTFGGSFATDGRPTGDVQIDTITCDQTTNTCPVTVHAPEFAMVFLSTSDPAVTDDTTIIQTFSTTILTKTVNTATVDPTVLATSNGHSGLGQKLGSTSKGSVKSGAMGWAIPNAVVLLAITVGGLIVGRGMLA